ncbi:MAG: efflux RND transporter periplasmic adaptor subunit [Acidobacteria bacterium]|nr:efflux RND transporter periplasmic adaptor subunit [Acidobacteriota bacterium]
MTKILGILLLVGLAVGGFWLVSGPSQAVAVRAIAVERADVANILTTNGRIEAAERVDVYSRAAGRVLSVGVEAGAPVKAGAVLATLDPGPAEAQRRQADARLEAARADLAALRRGPSPVERSETASQIASTERKLAAQREDRAALERLVERKAAPRVELEAAERQVAALEGELAALRRKLDPQPAPEALESAQAAVNEAQAAVEIATRAQSEAVVRAPVAGVAYSAPVRVGDYVTPGTLLARIAAGKRLEALIFVDEPELGRVQLGDEATLTADAYPGKSWTCRVDRLPTEVIELESRRVGELRCAVAEDQADLEWLIPNLTVDVAIRTAFAANVLSLPREAIERRGSEETVWTLDDASLVRRKVIETGVRGPDRVEVRAGLSEGQRVLLPDGQALVEGQPVVLEGAP